MCARVGATARARARAEGQWASAGDPLEQYGVHAPRAERRARTVEHSHLVALDIDLEEEHLLLGPPGLHGGPTELHGEPTGLHEELTGLREVARYIAWCCNPDCVGLQARITWSCRLGCGGLRWVVGVAPTAQSRRARPEEEQQPILGPAKRARLGVPACPRRANSSSMVTARTGRPW